MASVSAPHNGFTLLKASDRDIGTAKPEVRPIQVMQLDLQHGLVKDLVRSARSGKGIQLALGHNPFLRFGSKTIDLDLTPEKFRHELYKNVNNDPTKSLSFVGQASHTLKVQKPEELASAGMEAALEKLKSSMAMIEQDKEAKKTQLYTSPVLPPKPEKRAAIGKSRPTALLKKPAMFNNNVTMSLPASPSLHSGRPATIALPPTSAPLKPQMTSPLRHAIIHLLAVRPCDAQTVQRQTRGTKQECQAILERITKPPQGSEWQLSEKAYKELDVWKFPYKSQGDRQRAIDNAIRAYDRMRLSREDKLWQMLLPKEKRGKGIILSKLNLNDNTARTGAIPRKGAENGGNSPAVANGERDGLLRPGNGLQAEPMVRSKSQESMKSKKPGEKDALTRRLLSNNPMKQTTTPATKPKEKGTQAHNQTRPAGSHAKVKSAEFIDQSDEDDDMDDLFREKPLRKAQPQAVHSAAPSRISTPKPSPNLANKAQPVPKPKPESSQTSAKKEQSNKTKPTGNALQAQRSQNLATSSSSQSSLSSSVLGKRKHSISQSSNSSAAATPKSSGFKTPVPPSKSTQLQLSPPASTTATEKSRPAKSPQPSPGRARVTNGAITPVSQPSISRPPSQASSSRTSSSSIAEQERIYSSDKDMKRKANNLSSRAPGAPKSGISKSQLDVQHGATALQSPDSDISNTERPISNNPTSNAEQKRKRAEEKQSPGSEHDPSDAKRRKVEDIPRTRSAAEPDLPDEPLSKRQAVELGVKYKEYWPAYERLYRELESSTVPRDENMAKWDLLLDMQGRLERMRRQMASAYSCALQNMYVSGTGDDAAEEPREHGHVNGEVVNGMSA